MNLEHFAARMENHARTVQTMVQNVTDEQARWNPNPESWSVLEVVNHLYDEERLDFRVRLDIILHRPGQEWPPIDPEGWVKDRRYNERDLKESLRNFLGARQASLDWLKTLSPPKWDAVYEAPWGPMTAGDMFAAWVAHDLLHLRQLVELQWAYTTQELRPYRVRYAGPW